MNTSKTVGEKIKSLREKKSLSVAELAKQSGLYAEQIERIERKEDIPSLAPLIKLAHALGVTLGAILDDQDESGPVIHRKEDTDEGIGFSNNAILSRRHMQYHQLAQSKAGRNMEPFIIEILPTSATDDFVLSSHDGEEFIYVLSGKVEISYGEFIYTLNEGDSIYYDSVVPHHVHGYKGKAAKVLAVIYANK